MNLIEQLNTLKQQQAEALKNYNTIGAEKLNEINSQLFAVRQEIARRKHIEYIKKLEEAHERRAERVAEMLTR